jgi:hypothetical protein
MTAPKRISWETLTCRDCPIGFQSGLCSDEREVSLDNQACWPMKLAYRMEQIARNRAMGLHTILESLRVEVENMLDLSHMKRKP